MKKEIMKRAWEIARAGKKQFCGKVREYFSEALKIAWREAKMEKEQIVIKQISPNEYEVVSGKIEIPEDEIWEMNGMKRLYLGKDKSYYDLNTKRFMLKSRTYKSYIKDLCGDYKEVY